MRRKKIEDKDTKIEKKSSLLSKFESMENSAEKAYKASESFSSNDTAGMLSSDTGRNYLKKRMTEEIVLWKKVYTSHVAQVNSFSKYTQRIEGMFSQINPDASLNIEFTNPQSIHSYEEVEEKVLNAFRNELFSFLVADAYDTYMEIETTEKGTNVYLSRLVEENILEGRDELKTTLGSVTNSSKSSYEIFEKVTDSAQGKDMVLIGVVYKVVRNEKQTQKTVNQIRSVRRDITV